MIAMAPAKKRWHMAKDTQQVLTNEFDERALWLRAAADLLREDFAKAGWPLPDKIRFGFSTKGKGTQKVSECWHSPASADGAYEIFIRADQDEPVPILGFLVRELVHAALPIDSSHSTKFYLAAKDIGLTGPMRIAVPNHLLEARLKAIADHLGPLPHRALNISWSPFAARKVQTGRMLKATCDATFDAGDKLGVCGYTVRVAAKWAKDYGVVCPKHGPITVKLPPDDLESELDQEPETIPPVISPDPLHAAAD